MIEFLKENGPEEFDAPTKLPQDDAVAASWQRLNRSWWERHPMRYDFSHEIEVPEFSPDFYREIDSRFYESLWEMMPWRKEPFDSLIDYDDLTKKDVLEIGVGCGTHAQLLARHARTFTGIDLTDYAVTCTMRRLALYRLRGRVLQMDAEQMVFDDNSFDFVWSWGVIHHSANTDNVLSQIHRVLRPGGVAVAMVYHRSLWNEYVRGALYYGFIRGGLLRGRSLHRVIQQATDGALARYYTVEQWRTALAARFVVEKTIVLGHKSQIVPLPWGRMKRMTMKLIPNGLGRFITNRRLMGYLLVSVVAKRETNRSR